MVMLFENVLDHSFANKFDSHIFEYG
jgi:hypothetical protein